MEIKDIQLLKHFSLVLRNKANGKDTDLIKAPALRHLSRKDLIEIITSPHFTKSKSIKEIDLLKMENEELLEAIGDQMIILSYIITGWINKPFAENKEQLPPTTQKNSQNQKPRNNGRKN